MMTCHSNLRVSARRLPALDTVAGASPSRPAGRAGPARRVRLRRHAGAAADGVLAADQLAANAVTATGSPGGRGTPGGRDQVIAVRLARTATSLLVEVWDGDDTPPALARHGPDAEGGRGLVIVDALSTAWGCYHPSRAGGEVDGKVVWCAVALPAETPVPAFGDTQDAHPRRAPAAGHAESADGRPAAGDPVDVFDDGLLQRMISRGTPASPAGRGSGRL
jgi:hypothetical protein